MRRGLVVLFVVSLLVTALGPVAASAEGDPVRVLSPFEEDSPEGLVLQGELDAFSAGSGIATVVEVANAQDFEDIITGDDPPDVVILQAFGIDVLEVADEVVPVTDMIRRRSLEARYGAHLLDRVTVDGQVLALPIKADVKSLVWYKPDVFDAYGYSTPNSLQELVGLSNQIVADGHTPWCNYIESGPATGWLGTDWVEDLLLGAHGGEVYDEWINHDIPFTAAPVFQATRRFLRFMNEDGFVHDRGNLTSIFFFDNAAALAADDCLMHRQASFFAQILDDPEGFSTFKMPSASAAHADAAMGPTTYVAALDNRRDVRSLMHFFASPRFGRTAVIHFPGWSQPNLWFDTSLYLDPLGTQWADIVHAAIQAGDWRPDASDEMPPEVGAGSFWVGMTELLDGDKTVVEVLADIEASWP